MPFTRTATDRMAKKKSKEANSNNNTNKRKREGEGEGPSDNDAAAQLKEPPKRGGSRNFAKQRMSESLRGVLLNVEGNEDEVSDDESEEGGWECLRCDTTNAFRRLRCSSCKGWKGGVRGGVPRKNDQTSMRDNHNAKRLEGTGDNHNPTGRAGKSEEDGETDEEAEGAKNAEDVLGSDTKVTVNKNGTTWQATILSHKERKNKPGYYVHYKGSKKSAKEWVPAEWISGGGDGDDDSSKGSEDVEGDDECKLCEDGGGK